MRQPGKALAVANECPVADARGRRQEVAAAMKTSRRLIRWSTIALMPWLTAMVPTESVEPDSAQEELAGQEGATYGRFRWIEGDLSVRRGNDLFTEIQANDPIVPGDVVATGPDG